MESSYQKKSSYNRQVHLFSRNFIKNFQETCKFFLSFNLFFLAIISIEFFFCLYFFRNCPNATFVPFYLAFFLLTFFSYLLLFFYFHTKRPDQYQSFKDQFINSCRSSLPSKKGNIEHHLSICSAISFLIKDLNLSPFSSLFKKLSKKMQDDELLLVKELLLIAAKEELLQQIRFTPTDIELHAALAKTYVKLSAFYQEKQQRSFFFKQQKKQQMKIYKEQFKISVKRAIEEFHILDSLAPNDPWVYAQLAKSYEQLGMTKKQMDQYEKILQIRPDDLDILYRLACCYFKLGFNAKGLQSYETLQNHSYSKAQTLLDYYGQEDLLLNEQLYTFE